MITDKSQVSQRFAEKTRSFTEIFLGLTHCCFITHIVGWAKRAKPNITVFKFASFYVQTIISLFIILFIYELSFNSFVGLRVAQTNLRQLPV